jgi:UDPglucose 6-dehydrogenase
MLFTSRQSAELIKYAANAFLAAKITFINEMAELCEKLGPTFRMGPVVSAWTAASGAKFLHAGPGYGGSYFPKDTPGLYGLRTRRGFLRASPKPSTRSTKAKG